MTSVEASPWLAIPAQDYEAHMAAVGQSAVLRAIFFRVYSAHKPKRLAVLGCTTGSDLQMIDAGDTELAVGVDLNPEYLRIAKERLAALGARLRLIEGDVLRVELPPETLDLVHAALLLEYVDPLSLFRRIRGWLAPGGICSVVTQQPSPDRAAVTQSPYPSLEVLSGHMRLRDAKQVATLAGQCGLRLVRDQTTTEVGGKSLVSSLFRRQSGATR
jgi:SAM-dependent methyltransferase